MIKLATRNAKRSGVRCWLLPLVGLFARPVLSRGEGASISPMFALLLVPIAGSVAYAVEVGGMIYIQRSMQNAADAAALAAASNNTGSATTGTTAQTEARAAARPYGYVNGSGSATVTASTTTCPAGVTAGSTCYQAIVSDVFPLTFSRLVGFRGDTAISGGGRGELLRARAVAVSKGGGLATDVCIWTFNHLQTDGTPQANLGQGCVALSSNTMTCNGNGINSGYAIAHATVSGPCAADTENNISGVSLSEFPPDKYAILGSSIPASGCGSYPQMVQQGQSNNYTVPNASKITALPAADVNGYIKLCGDIQIQNDIAIPAGKTLVIYNGRLDVAGHKLTADSGTLVFSGTADVPPAVYKHYPMDTSNGSNGEVKIKAPLTAGHTWKDVAIYQDPALTTGVSFTYTGNKPTWTIFGVMYFPKAAVDFRGIVNKYAGQACQILIAYSARISGTGKIIGDQTNCHDAGIDPPVFVGPSTRERLVL